MEKATKKMEDEKTLAKFTSSQKEALATKCCKLHNTHLICVFLERGAPAQYSSRKHQLYNQSHNSN